MKTRLIGVLSLCALMITGPATAASVALSVNSITNFDISASVGSFTFSGWTFSNDTAATEGGGTGGADTMDAPAACIGDCIGWGNEFFSHAPSSTEYSYGDAQILSADVLNGNGAASSIGEVNVIDGVAHAAGSNVLTSISLFADPGTKLDFSFDANALLQTTLGTGAISNAANMFFNITLTDSVSNPVFTWTPNELNHGITGTNSYTVDQAFSMTTGELNGNYTLNIKMENQANAAAVVPVPATVWLFGSGLLGMIGIARRKKAA